MELDIYLEKIRSGLVDAAALADENTRDIAERLGAAVDASARLALLAALSDAMDQVSTEMAPGAVQMSLEGDRPSFVVTLPESIGESDSGISDSSAEREVFTGPAASEDEPQARVSLRLPQSVKDQVEVVAAAEGLSINTWLVQQTVAALQQGRSPQQMGPSEWLLEAGTGRVKYTGAQGNSVRGWYA